MSAHDLQPAQTRPPDLKPSPEAHDSKLDPRDLAASDCQDVAGLGNDFVQRLMLGLDGAVGLDALSEGRCAPEDLVSPAMDVAQEGQARPLPYKDELEERFQTDLSDVEAHVGTPQAQVGLVLSRAEAATEDRSVMFLDPAPDLETVAHEVVHLEQGTAGTAHALSQRGQAAEQEAEVLAADVAMGESVDVHEQAPAGTAHRSLFGAILGGVLGAVGGAVAGFFTGGPLGAVLGGVVGAVGGFAVGDKLSTESRSLSSDEIAYAREIYAGSVDYGPITITRDSAISAGAPKTIGNTIHLKSTKPWNHFVGDTMELTNQGRECLIHEMCHVWQYQHGGYAYIGDSLWAQLKASIGGGDRGGAYEWQDADAAGIPWEDWNPEQQAKAVEDYNIAFRAVQDAQARGTKPASEDTDTLTRLQPYIDKVRAGQGAPQFSAPGAVAGGILGAGFGAGVGALVGGPVGALVGGVIGGIGGALFGGG